MALTYRILYKNCIFIGTVTKTFPRNVWKNHPIRILSSASSYQNNYVAKIAEERKYLNTSSLLIRQCSTQGGNMQKQTQESKTERPGLIQRFKEMYRDYWYVLLPVHMVTSTIWFGSFYYVVRSGVDVLGFLESIGISDSLMKPLRESGAGYFALAFALYKLVTPLRYAVTVGGTTYAIKRLTTLGWIKPVPSRERLKEMIQERKDNLQDRFQVSKQHYQTQMKEKHTQVMDEMRRYKTEIRNMKDKVKKT